MGKLFFRTVLITGALFVSLTCFSAADVLNPLQDSLTSDQLIIAVSDNWNSIRVSIYCYEKVGGKWELKFSFPAVAGKNGMAMGEGIRVLQMPRSPVKKEGDLKSPAGFFKLGPAFGYAAKEEAGWIRLPYVRASDTLFCVDDMHSIYYNDLVKTDTVKTDWKSHEDMHRKDAYYRWGIFVQHNFDPVEKGKGSCIFLHIWENENEGTTGCTAMDEKNILKILSWIREDKSPLLVQLPLPVYLSLRLKYNLPDLRN